MSRVSRDEPVSIGVINPFALAEAVTGEEIDWEHEDPRKVLPQALGQPYERLFDPRFGSPLYSELRFDPKTLEVSRVDLEDEEEVAVEGVNELADFPTDADEIKTDADRPEETSDMSDVMSGVSAGAIWKDKGVFLHEAAEFFDPIQGAVGDCYLIAAMSSVAWALTYDIAHRSRATGTTQESFVDMISFHDGSGEVRVEVTEKVPVNSTGNYIYCRSSEDGEIWPAVYEKAYAKWRTNHAGDTPDIRRIAGGDPVAAAAQLTGRSKTYYWTANSSPDTVYKRVRENSLSHKTFNPMVAWTYSSGDKSPDKVNYNNASLVANHAYSILGWDWRDGVRYIILRNPWGQREASTGYLAGSWVSKDTPYYGGPGWWRRIELAKPDGVFGLQVEVFKKYFAGFGVVK